VPVLLALAALAWMPPAPAGTSARAWFRRDPAIFYWVLAVVSVLVFLPPPVGLWPHLYWLPGMNFIRVPSRFMILAITALGVAAGVGFDRLTAALLPRQRALAAVVAATLIVGEYASMPLFAEPYAVDIPAIDRWLATQPKPFAIAEAPMPSVGDLGAYVRWNTMAMFHATAHWQKTIHGYSGIQPALHDRVFEHLTLFPDEVSIADLRDMGVTHVVVHADAYSPEKWLAIEARLAGRTDLRLVHTEGAGRVYAIVR
jgi:hypothetical protein